MGNKETAKILFRVLPVPQEQLAKLHRRGRLKEKVEQLIPLLRRSYARVFHSDSERNDKRLLDDILQDINSGLDDIKNIDEASYSGLVRDLQNYELGISISPEKLQELKDTTNALEELLVKTEDLQRELDDLRKSSPDIREARFYSSLIDTYGEYLGTMSNLKRDENTNLVNSKDLLRLRNSLRQLRDLAQTKGKFNNSYAKQVVRHAENVFREIKRDDLEVLENLCNKYERISEKKIGKMSDAEIEEIQEKIKGYREIFELYNVGGLK